MEEGELEGETLGEAVKNGKKSKYEIPVDSDHDDLEIAFTQRDIPLHDNEAEDPSPEDLVEKRLLENMEMIHSNLTEEGAVFNTHEPNEDVGVLE